MPVSVSSGSLRVELPVLVVVSLCNSAVIVALAVMRSFGICTGSTLVIVVTSVCLPHSVVVVHVSSVSYNTMILSSNIVSVSTQCSVSQFCPVVVSTSPVSS